MVPKFQLDMQETFNGDIMVKELPDYSNVIPFDECVSITVLIKETTMSRQIEKAFIHDHRITDVMNRFFIKTDGRYIILHAVVPTKGWLDKQSEEDLKKFKTIIIYNNGELFLNSNGQLIQVELDILEDESLEESSIQVMKKDVFVLFNLWQCYLNYCKKLFEGECSKDTKCTDCKDELTENRNLLWIFLNAIQYYMKLGEPAKAQELLENISAGCNTLCSNEMFSKEYNCGCGK